MNFFIKTEFGLATKRQSGRYLGYIGKIDIYNFNYAKKEFYSESTPTGFPCIVHYWIELPLAPQAK